MNPIRHLALGFALISFISLTNAADLAPFTAASLASRLNAQRENSSSEVRLRMELQQPAGTKTASFQIQIRERRGAASTDVAYLILWPKDRKGQALLVHQSPGSAPIASLLMPDKKSPVSLAMNQPVFGSDLAIADTIENFFSWKNQALIGTEIVNGVSCQILESKPGARDFSIYESVRSWIDPGRLVPLRIQKYLSGGKLARIIDTTRVVPERGYGNLPADLTVRDPAKNSLTQLDGSRIRRDVQFSDHDFSFEGLNQAASLPVKE